jgi:hypothetical protein
MSKPEVSPGTLRGFSYLSMVFPELDLVVSPVSDDHWEALYLFAFGAAVICRKWRGRASMEMEGLENGCFTVSWQSDDEDLLRDLESMTSSYGSDPRCAADAMLMGQHAGANSDPIPDHLAIIDRLQKIRFDPEEPRQPKVVWSHDLDVAATPGVGAEAQIAYWGRYWNTPSDKSRPQ